MNFLLLPISKITPLGKRTISDIRKAFGFESWINQQSNIEIFNRYPGLKNNIENRFEKVFQNHNYLNIDDLTLLITSAEIQLRVKQKDHLRPFYYYGDFEFETTAYDIIYIQTIEPKLAIRLPTILNGMHIEPGYLQGATIIPSETIQSINFEEFRNSIELPESDEFLGGNESLLDEIMNGIKEAKKRECDFFTYVG